MAGQVDDQPAHLGFWPMLSVSAQYQRLRLEPQTGLPHLLRTGTEPEDLAQEAPETGQA